MSQIYEIIIFTASQKQYADKVIAQIDPRKRISHVLHRDHCLIINKTYYLKNLKILGRDLKQTILVDVNYLFKYRTIRWQEYCNRRIFTRLSNF